MVTIHGVWVSASFTRNTYKIEPIEAWLDTNNIPASRVLTWVDLSHHWTHGISMGTRLPGEFEGQRFMIDWPSVARVTKKNGYTHLLTSGIGMQAAVGKGDPILSRSTALARWPHPERPERPVDDLLSDFKIYRISDLLALEVEPEPTEETPGK